MKKILKYFAVILVSLVLIIAALGYYFLGSNQGLNNLLELTNKYSGYQIKADNIEGDLLGKVNIENLSIVGEDTELRSQHVQLYWSPKSLLQKKLIINDFSLSQVTLNLSPKNTAKKTEDSSILLPDIKLPFSIELNNISLSDVTIQSPTLAKDFVIDRLQLRADYQTQIANIHHLSMNSELIDINTKGRLETAKSYPLKFNNNIQLKHPQYGQQAIGLVITGDLAEALDLNLDGHGLANFSLSSQLQSVLEQPQFSANLDLQSIDVGKLGLVGGQLQANLNINGGVADRIKLTAMGKVDYNSPETARLQLNLESYLDGNNLMVEAFTLDLLDAQQQLTGQASYQLDSQQLFADIHSKALYWPQVGEIKQFYSENLNINLSGEIEDYLANITGLVWVDNVPKVELNLKAKGSTQALTQSNFTASSAAGKLIGEATATWSPAISFEAKINSEEITPFANLPGIKNLQITAAGSPDNYQAKIQSHVYSDTIPPSDIVINAVGDSKQLSDLNLSVKTLSGEIKASGQLEFPPNLDFNAALDVRNIKPQSFYPEVEATVNGQLHVTGKQASNGELNAVISLKKLMGNWQKQPLSGLGEIEVQGSNITVKKLNIDLANNIIVADGHASNQQLDLNFELNAQNLKNLLPSLSGDLQAKGKLAGSPSKPKINLTAKSKGLKYQQNQMAKLDLNADIDLKLDKLNLALSGSDIQISGNEIQQAKVDIKGKFSQHQADIDVLADKQKLQLRAKGKLNLEKQSWAGSINKLDLSQEVIGQWQLKQASKLSLSAEKVSIDKFCLAQKSSHLCVEGKLKNKNGEFEVTMAKLDTKSFQKLMPSVAQLLTIVDGKANIKLKNGQPQVEGSIAAKGGALNISSAGSISSKVKQLSADFKFKNNQLASVVKADFEQLAKLEATISLPNFNKPNINAKLKIKADNLKFIEKLAPQLSDISGKIDGDIAIQGDPNKRLSITGDIGLRKTSFNIPQYGSEIRDLELKVFAKNGNSFGFAGGAKAGKGNIEISGDIDPISQQGNINIKGDDLQVANSKKLQIEISPNLDIILNETIKIRGEVVIPRTMIVPEAGTSKIKVSDDVVLPSSKEKNKQNSPIDAEIAIKLGDEVRIASADITTRLLGGIKVSAKPNKAPQASGVIEVETGELRIYGQQLNIDRGRVIFGKGPIDNPALDIQTSREIEGEDITVGANILGYAQSPEISLFSTPSMGDSSILSYLIFGKPPSSDSFGSAALLQAGGAIGASSISKGLKDSTGLDVFDINLTGMEAGKNFSKKFYLGMRANFFDAINEFLVKYKINSRFQFEAATSAQSTAADLIYSFEKD